MGLCISRIMKKAVLLFLCIFITSCASKSYNAVENNCTVKSINITSQDKNLLINFVDNGCTYSYEQVDTASWKISVKNGKLKSSSLDINGDSDGDIIGFFISKKDNFIEFNFAKKGVLTQNTSNTFIYNQTNYKKEIPAEKASYIERMDCYEHRINITSNGALYSTYGELYNGQKYIDIFNVSLKQGYTHGKDCVNISSPVTLKYPKRLRYFINDIQSELVINNTKTGIALSFYDDVEGHLITGIREENTQALQKIIIETSSNIRVLSVDSNKDNTIVVLNGKYDVIKKASYKNEFMGNFFKNIEVNKKSEVTEIKLNNRTAGLKNFISIDRVDNKLIIYATKM